MSKYTTEVRFICEQKAGLKESVGYDKVDSVLDASWDKVLTATPEMFNADYRPILYKKVLKHYYTREICAETVGLWQLWMNRTIEEVMPLYNELYKAQAEAADLLFDTDMTTTYREEGSGKNTENGSSTSGNEHNETWSDEENSNRHREADNTNTHTINESDSGSNTGSVGNTHSDDTTVTPNTTQYVLRSDTPQGGLSGVDSYTYLTDATKTTESGTTKTANSGKSTDTTSSEYSDKRTGTNKDTITENSDENTGKTGSGNRNTTDNGTATSTKTGNSENTKEFIQRVYGKSGGVTYAQAIKEVYENFISIDRMFIEEFKEMFMCIY